MDESNNDLIPIQNMVSVTTINNIDEAGKYKLKFKYKKMKL